MRHPLHPALVHFPIACWSIAAAADFASLRYGEAAWRLAVPMLVIGCLVAVAAMLAGLVELIHVPDGAATTDAWWHMGLMTVAFALFLLSLVVRLHELRAAPPTALSLGLDAVGFVTLMMGSWLGGRLVYGHGVGRD